MFPLMREAVAALIEPLLAAMQIPAGRAGGDGDSTFVPSDLSAGSIIPDVDWREMEKLNLLNALTKAHWKVSGKGGAAELLGLRPSTLESRMKANRRSPIRALRIG